MLTATNPTLLRGDIASQRITQGEAAPAIDRTLVSEEKIAQVLSEDPTLRATLSSNVIKVVSLHAGRAIEGPLKVTTSQSVIDDIHSQLESCRPSRVRNNSGQDLTVIPARRALIARQPELEAYYTNHPQGRAQVVEAARTMPIADLFANLGVQFEGTTLLIGKGARFSLNFVTPNQPVSIDGFFGFNVSFGPSHVSAVIDHDRQMLFAGAPSIDLVRRSTLLG